MDLRPLTSQDAEAYEALYLEGVTNFPTAFLRTAEEVRATRSDEIARVLDSGKITGAFEAGDLIGLAGLEPHNLTATQHRAMIGPFYVKPSHHGGGVAQALMDELVRRAGEMGVIQLELVVWSGNPRAQKFYARNGFVQTGVMPRSVRIGGEYHDDFFMVRALDC